MKERDCRVTACTDGECRGCKNKRRLRRQQNVQRETLGEYALRKCTENGWLPEMLAEATVIAEMQLCGLDSLCGLDDMTEGF